MLPDLLDGLPHIELVLYGWASSIQLSNFKFNDKTPTAFQIYISINLNCLW